MKLARMFVLVGVLVLFMISAAACGGGAKTEAPVIQEPQEIAPTEEVVQPSEGEEQTPATDIPTEPAMPPDVPIMENVRDFQTTADFSNISFVVDLEVADVVAWYQAELPNYGWELSRAPDTSMATMANMSRINAENDRITLSLQHNPIGQFTVVRIVVVRAP